MVKKLLLEENSGSFLRYSIRSKKIKLSIPIWHLASTVHLLFLLVFSNNPIKQVVFFFFFSYFTHEKRGAQEGEGLYGHLPRKYMMELGSESSLAVIRVRANILCNLASRNQFQGPLFRAQDSPLSPGLSWRSLTSQALRAAQHFH